MSWIPKIWQKPDGRKRTHSEEEVALTVEKSKITRLKTQSLRMLREELEYLNQRKEENRLREQIEDIKQDMLEDEEAYEDEPIQTDNSIESQLLAAVVGPILAKTNTQPNTNVSPPSTDKINMTDSELVALKGTVPPKHIKQIKGLTPELQLNYIRKAFPTLDEDSILRARALI